ncbi:MAG: glycosyltransferase [Elusimicrobia bacterium]|nr:glycosyltransferase [Elusimicrobiota bacterium]
MKIVYLVGGFPSLSQTFILDQITGLIDRGHEVEILAYHDPREGQAQNAVRSYGLLEKTRYLRYEGDQPLLDAGNVRQLAPCLDADVVHAHFAAKPADIALDILKKAGIPFVLTAHAYDIFIQPDAPALRAKFLAASKAITVSEYNKRYLADLLGPDLADKIEVSYLGVDLKRFPWNERAPGANVTLLFAGRLVEKKGVLDLIEAFALVCARHPLTRLRIIGDGPQREAAAQKAQTLGVGERVTFLGALTQERIAAEMQRADIFCLPAATAVNGDREGLPVVLLEAQASGLPVVSTRHTGIPEAVADGETGLLVDERDPQGLSRSISRLIEDPALRVQMGRAGRKRIEARHDLGAELDRLESVLAMAAQAIQDGSGAARMGRYYAEVMERLELRIREQGQELQRRNEQADGQARQSAQSLRDVERRLEQKLQALESRQSQDARKQDERAAALSAAEKELAAQMKALDGRQSQGTQALNERIEALQSHVKKNSGFIRSVKATWVYRLYKTIRPGSS